MWPRPEGIDALFALSLTALAGWLWGSFLNQLVDRSPFRQPSAPGHADSRLPGPPPGVTPWRPARSLCFACSRHIPWHENVPVFSYLRLRGRCRGCGAPFGRRTLVLEAATPLALLAWHGAIRALGGTPGLLWWGFALVSWLLVGLALFAEGRHAGRAFLAVGLMLAAFMLVGAALAWPRLVGSAVQGIP